MCEGDGMEEWKEYVLSELIDEISMGPFGSNIKVECFTDSGVPVLNGSNLVGLKLNEDKFNYVTEEKAASLGKANAYRNDIVITHRGTLGQIVYIPQNSKYDHYVISQSQFRIRCNQNVLPEYLVYYFHTRIGQHQLLSNASQVGVPALARPTTTFQKLRVVLPPLPTQQKIAAILSSLDDKIELNNKINTNLEQQAQALFKNWFVDFEPFGGKMSEGWKECKAEEYFEITIGKTPPRKEQEWFSEEKTNQTMKWVSISDMGSCGLFISDSSEYLTTEAVAKFNVKVVPANTIILSFKLTVGRIAITDDEMCTNEAIAHFGTKNKVINEYLYLYLKNFNYQTMGSTSSIATAVNSKIIKAMPFILPNEKTINDFHLATNSLFEKIRENQHENSTLSTIRDTLLPKLMNGEINI